MINWEVVKEHTIVLLPLGAGLWYAIKVTLDRAIVSMIVKYHNIFITREEWALAQQAFITRREWEAHISNRENPNG